MITVVIPTNRYQCVKQILDLCISTYTGQLFRFEIHDSSSDCKIETLINQYNNIKTKQVKYIRYDIAVNPDEKSIVALTQVKTEYFWLMGDGLLVDFNRIEDVLQKESFERYQVIDVESIYRLGHLGQDKSYEINKIYSFKDGKVFAKKYFSHLTYWGAAIIETKFFIGDMAKDVLSKYSSNKIPWWIACTLFDIIATYQQQLKSVSLGVIYSDSIESNPKKGDHWWTRDERYYIYTFVKFNEGLKLLSDFYDDECKKIIATQFQKDSLVHPFHLIHLRGIGTLNAYFLDKFKHDISYIPETYDLMERYLLLPQYVAKIIDIIQVYARPIYKRLKKSLIKRRK